MLLTCDMHVCKAAGYSCCFVVQKALMCVPECSTALSAYTTDTDSGPPLVSARTSTPTRRCVSNPARQRDWPCSGKGMHAGKASVPDTATSPSHT